MSHGAWLVALSARPGPHLDWDWSKSDLSMDKGVFGGRRPQWYSSLSTVVSPLHVVLTSRARSKLTIRAISIATHPVPNPTALTAAHIAAFLTSWLCIEIELCSVIHTEQGGIRRIVKTTKTLYESHASTACSNLTVIGDF